MRGAQQIALTIVLLLASSTMLWAQSHIPWVSTWQEARLWPNAISDLC